MALSPVDKRLEEATKKHYNALDERMTSFINERKELYEHESILEEFLAILEREQNRLKFHDTEDEVSSFKDSLLVDYQYLHKKFKKGSQMLGFLKECYPSTLRNASASASQRKGVSKRHALDLELMESFSEEKVIDLVATYTAYEQYKMQLLSKLKLLNHELSEEEIRLIANVPQSQYKALLFAEEIFRALKVENYTKKHLIEFILLLRGENIDEAGIQALYKASRRGEKRSEDLIEKDFQSILAFLDKLKATKHSPFYKLKHSIKNGTGDS